MGKEVGKLDEPIRFGHDIQQIQDAIATLDQAFDGFCRKFCSGGHEGAAASICVED
jgi:hypothetical protein